jgi:hypothetical protein
LGAVTSSFPPPNVINDDESLLDSVPEVPLIQDDCLRVFYQYVASPTMARLWAPCDHAILLLAVFERAAPPRKGTIDVRGAATGTPACRSAANCQAHFFRRRELIASKGEGGELASQIQLALRVEFVQMSNARCRKSDSDRYDHQRESAKCFGSRTE